MADTVTVTGKSGPDQTVTAVVITDVTKIEIDTVNSVLSITGVIGSMQPSVHEFDIRSQNTVTVTKSGLNWTVVVS